MTLSPARFTSNSDDALDAESVGWQVRRNNHEARRRRNSLTIDEQRERLELAEDFGDPVLIAEAKVLLTRAYYDNASTAHARTEAFETLNYIGTLRHGLIDYLFLSILYIDLGRLAAAYADAEGAIYWATKAYDAATLANDLGLQEAAISNLIDARLAMGDADGALCLVRDVISQPAVSVVVAGTGFNTIGVIASQIGDYALAQESFELALEHEPWGTNYWASIVSNLVSMDVLCGNYAEALERVTGSLPRSGEQQSWASVELTLLACEVAVDAGEPDRAATLFQLFDPSNFDYSQRHRHAVICGHLVDDYECPPSAIRHLARGHVGPYSLAPTARRVALRLAAKTGVTLERTHQYGRLAHRRNTSPDPELFADVRGAIRRLAIEAESKQFNELRERTLTLQLQRHQIHNTISQDLRRPLTVLQLALTCVGMHGESVAERDMVNANDAYEQLVYLIDTTFLSAEVAADTVFRSPRLLDLKSTIVRCVADVGPWLRQSSQKATAFIDSTMVHADEDTVRAVLQAVLVHGSVYSPPGATFTVALHPNEDLCVEIRGSDRAFERVRGEDLTIQNVEASRLPFNGHSIGLNSFHLANQLCKKAGWKLSFDPDQPRVIINFGATS